MIITKTPYRVSLFGGGSDHPSWYKKYTGSVLSFAIDKYCYINLRELPPFFEHSFRVAYSKIETVKAIDEIKHPAVRESFRKYAPDLCLEMHHHGDLPARSGIGSSSSFAVGLILALLSIKNKKVSQSELAELAIQLEQEILLENVGSQDQIASAFGGINFIQFGPGANWKVEPIKISPRYLNQIENSCVLIYSGVERSSSEVSKTLLRNLDSKIVLMKKNQELAITCREILEQGDNLSLIGPLLNESWEIKKQLNSDASTPVLESLFTKAMKVGAQGGKVLGAGGGGFCLFWVDPSRRNSFIQEMAPLVAVPVKLSMTGATRIV